MLRKFSDHSLHLAQQDILPKGVLGGYGLCWPVRDYLAVVDSPSRFVETDVVPSRGVAHCRALPRGHIEAYDLQMPTLSRLALTREDKGEPCLRLNYSGRPRGFERFTLDEQRDLNPDICPCCAKRTDWTRIEHDVVGGKHLAYVMYQCDQCGWWNVFKYWEDREGEMIFAVNRLQPFLYDFSSRGAAVPAVLGLLKRDFVLLREIHWRVFEQLVQKFFSEQGFTVVDVSKYPTVGGDLLLIGLDGKRILVEVKHLKYDPVGVGVVHKLRSVIQVGGYDAGLVVTSNRFSKDAIKLMGRTDEKYRVNGKDCADIAKWLNLIELRSAKEIKGQLKQFVDDDAMNEM